MAMRRMPADRSLAALVRRASPSRTTCRGRPAARRVPQCRGAGSGRHARGLPRGGADPVGGGPRRPAAPPGALLPATSSTGSPGRRPVPRRPRGPVRGRRAEARVVDGHGDLLAEDMFCLADGPVMLDCLEFDDRLRYVDGLDDTAFLAMDLERLGGPEPAARFLRLYAEFAADPAPPALRHHFVAYRAAVRAAVTCLRVDQGGGDAEEAATCSTSPTATCRMPGSASCSSAACRGRARPPVAGGVADRLGAVLVSSDRVRKELAGLNPTDPAAAEYRDGLYRPEHTERLTRPCSTGPRSCSAGARRSCSTRRGPSPAPGPGRGARRADVLRPGVVALRCPPGPGGRAHPRSRRVGLRRHPARGRGDVGRRGPRPQATTVDTSGAGEDSVTTATTAVRAPRRHGSWTVVEV